MSICLTLTGTTVGLETVPGAAAAAEASGGVDARMRTNTRQPLTLIFIYKRRKATLLKRHFVGKSRFHMWYVLFWSESNKTCANLTVTCSEVSPQQEPVRTGTGEAAGRVAARVAAGPATQPTLVNI